MSNLRYLAVVSSLLAVCCAWLVLSPPAAQAGEPPAAGATPAAGAEATVGAGGAAATPATAAAAEPGKKAAVTPDVEEQEINFFSLLARGGVIGWTIVALSFVTLALVLENFVTIRREKFVPPDVLGELEELFEKQEYDAALELCEVERSLLTNVVGSGLAKLNAGWTQMENAMSESADEVSTGLYQKVGYLNLIGNLSPMLGLLGTVVGMVNAFMVIATSSDNPKPDELARGIYQALITTVEGLIVAIPALAAYFFFRNRVAKLLLEAGAVTGELMERFRPHE